MKSSKKAISLLIAGIILASGPLWGLLGTVLGMIGAFEKIGSSNSGETELLANDIGFALWTTLAGLIVCPIGILFLIISIIWLVKLNRDQQNINENFK